MKLFLLKILLQHRNRDEGFTLPMVMALGLVMLLLSAINLTSANEENLTAITQNSRSDALAIAEIGVTRYRELLDRNRLLTLYDSSEWLEVADGIGAAEDTDVAELCEGEIASFFPGTSNSVTIAEDGLVLNNDGDTTDTFTTGSYSLVSYEYNLTSGSTNFDQTDDAVNVDGSGNGATGTLTVKGETPDGNEAQIEVDIPIRINQQDMGNLEPALWIGNDAVTKDDLGDGSLTVTNGNVVLKDSAVTTSGSEADGCGDFATLATNTGLPIISDPRSVPDIQPIIDTIIAAQAVTQTNTSIADGTLGETNEKPYVDPPSGTAFHESVHCSNIRDCRYYYYLNASPTNINSDITTDGIAKATLYVDSVPLNINANANNVSIGSGVSSNYFEIYVNGNNDVTINTAAGFTLTVNAFIHAPNSTLKITGDGTVDINGSVWVNDIESSTSATVNITPDRSNISSTLSSEAYEFYTTTTNRTAKPLTDTPTNWKTEEITP